MDVIENCDKIVCIVERIKKLPVKGIIDLRMKEFKSFFWKNSNDFYKELCFCFLTANFNAEKSILIQKEIDDGFLYLPEDKIAQKLSSMGHRFPNTRASYIVKARKYKDTLKEDLGLFRNDHDRRKWLVDNIKGVGFKEASHFLRNVGYTDVAIIDFHIIDLLLRNDILKDFKTMTPKKYLEVEKILDNLAKRLGLSLGELDLYLWYEETGKVLK